MKINHERYQLIPGTGKCFFFINSDTITEDIEFINTNNIENIQVNYRYGYTIKDINPLTALKNIKTFYVHISGTDLSCLSGFRALEVLSINDINRNINLSGLSNLGSLSLVFQENILGLDSLINLESLNIIKAGKSFFTKQLFSCWPKLNFLQFLSPQLPGNLSFIAGNKMLENLEIHYCRSSFNINDLIYVKESLEELTIGNCKKVEGLEMLSELKNLKRLSFVNSVVLKNIDFTKELTKLEILVVIGSSYFEDGDIKSLKGRIKYVSIDNKKHYNMKDVDFKIQN